MNRMDYQTFIEMLGRLNRFIVDEYDPEYVLDIRAIGGFSMIIHKRLGRINSPREKSRDIDSLTPDYPEEIIAAIKRIGEEYGANDPDGWLNNHWNKTKNYNEEFEFFINWEKLDSVHLSNINIYYANLESMLMFKIRAMDDRINLAHSEPREQDILDVVSILRAFNITDLNNIKNESIENTLKYFPNALKYLTDNGLFKGTVIS